MKVTGRPDAVICISLSEWGDVPHNSRHLMAEASRRGYSVLYVESIGLRAVRLTGRDARKVYRRLRRQMRPLRRVGTSFWVYAPFALPFHGSRFIQRLNVWLLAIQLRTLKKRLGFERVLYWSYLPQMVQIGARLGASRSLYFRTDDYTSFPNVPSDLIEASEREAVRSADLCVGVAQRYLEGPLLGARAAVWVPNGVELEHFVSAPNTSRSRTPISLLTVGTLDSWLAVEMLRDAAELRPNWEFVLAGPIRTELEGLLRLPNVDYRGVVPYEQLPALMAASHVGLVPFRLGAVAEGATPGKLFQYLAAGRPVIATRAVDPPENLRPFVALIEEEGARLVSAVEALLADDAPEAEERRREAVRMHSWANRFDAIEQALGFEGGTAR